METLRNATGRVIGRLEESGNVVKLYNVAGKMQGSYDKKLNITKNTAGTVVARSNTLVSLLKN